MTVAVTATAAPTVPLSSLPGVSRLAGLHGAGDERARPFLPDSVDIRTIAARASDALSRFVSRGPDPASRGDLTAFVDGSRAAVTTGQQVGVFTGPLLSAVKASAALSLARALAAAGTDAGAVFWCASEDHDLIEVTRVLLPSAGGPVETGPEAALLERNRRPVGALAVPPEAEAIAARVPELFSGLPFSAQAAELAGLSVGRTLHGAFVDSLAWLLAGEPLAFYDAARREEKPLLLPLALRIVRERREVRARLAERAAALAAAGFPPQVTSEPSALPLFLLVSGERLLLREEGGRFSLKGYGEDRTFQEIEILERLASGEWLPSFSALTRPLAASVLLPVAATILGPAEVAYWAQMLPLFDWAGVVRPVVVPRPVVAPVDAVMRRLLARTGLAVGDLLAGRESVVARRGAGTAAGLLGRLEAARDGTGAALDGLKDELVGLDPALGRAVETTRQNVTFAFGRLAERAAAAAGRADEEWTRSVDKLFASLLPGGRLAERTYSPLPWIARYGREALATALHDQVRWNAAGLVEIDL